MVVYHCGSSLSSRHDYAEQEVLKENAENLPKVDEHLPDKNAR